LISGHTSAHQALEEALANYTRQEKALLFSTGYTANMGVFSALRDELDTSTSSKVFCAPSFISKIYLYYFKLTRMVCCDFSSTG
jgi:7-keto-8-aminopelargonate synthetase-like enzyme